MDSVLVIIITIVFSAWFSGMEIAYIASNKLKIEIDKGKGLMTARILSKFTREPSHLIGTLLLGNNIALVIYGIAMANLLNPFIERLLPENLHTETLILILQTIIATLVILVTAEFIPKALFRLNSNTILNFFALILSVFYYLLYPIVFLFTGLAKLLLKYLFRVEFTKDEKLFTPIDLDEYIRELSTQESHMEDVQQEIQMFQNVIDFRKVKVRECMVPRNEIIAAEEDEEVSVLRDRFIEFNVTRIPVYRESVDDIIGYVHSFDMFKQPGDLRSIIKPLLHVPETVPANVLLSMFIREQQNIAIVLDEFGGTSGMVTMEDVIEEIFGEIEDEFDDSEDMVERVITPLEYIFSARLEIDYLNDKYKLNLPESEEYETLAGLIIHYHESIPSESDTISVLRFRFDILQATEARIELVRLRIDQGE